MEIGAAPPETRGNLAHPVLVSYDTFRYRFSGMKLPITADPKREELENLAPEHIAYLEDLKARVHRYNLGEEERPVIAPNVRAILHHYCAAQTQRELEEFYREEPNFFDTQTQAESV